MEGHYELRRLNSETFEAEAKREVAGSDWESYLRSVLADDFVLRRSRSDVPNETKNEMLDRIRRTEVAAARTVLPESVDVLASGTLGVVTSVVTMPGDGGTQAFQNVKVFRGRDHGAWVCVYWQVTARPMPEL